MAIILQDDYAGRIDITDPTGYPYGKFKNVQGGVNGTGTPLERAWANDIHGFLQNILTEASITPSGSPDKVGVSDYQDALDFIYGKKVKYIADIATKDLANLDKIETSFYDTVGDNGGATYSHNGVTTPAKAGASPDLSVGTVYDINGKEFVYDKTVLFDRAFGIKTSDQSTGLHIDVTTQLDDFVAFGRLRAAQDGLAKGGSNLFFTPRQELEKTGTLNIVDYYLTIDFNNTTIYQQDSTNDIINWEGNGAGVRNLWLQWDSAITPEDFYNGTPAGFRISGGQPIATISESVFSKLQNIWIWGGWDGFKLDSQAPFGGLFWQFIMESCYVTGHMNRSYNFVSIAQVSTTSSFRNCHAGCKVRARVNHSGNSYLALQHMEASNPIEPNVTVGWEAYWELETVFIAADLWVTNTFYRTMGKGWLINNIQTTEMLMCSLDGAHNEQDGNVIDCLNSVLSVSDFHLEGHNLSKADGISMLIGSDCKFGILYMFDLRLRCGGGNNAYLIGGVLNRNRNITVEGVRNQNQAAATSGTLKYINGGKSIVAFNHVACGTGVPRHLTVEMPESSSWVRKWDGDEGQGSPTLGLVTVTGGTIGTVTPIREQEGSEFRTDASNTMEVTLDLTEIPIGVEYTFFNETGTITALDTLGTTLSTTPSPTLGVVLYGTNPSTAGKLVTIKRQTATKFRMSEW